MFIACSSIAHVAYTFGRTGGFHHNRFLSSFQCLPRVLLELIAINTKLLFGFVNTQDKLWHAFKLCVRHFNRVPTRKAYIDCFFLIKRKEEKRVWKMGRHSSFLSHRGKASQSINIHAFGMPFVNKNTPLFGLDRFCTLSLLRFPCGCSVDKPKKFQLTDSHNIRRQYWITHANSLGHSVFLKGKMHHLLHCFEIRHLLATSIRYTFLFVVRGGQTTPSKEATKCQTL